MQLGTRWAIGTRPPGSVPEALLPAIAEVETHIADTARPAYWTLTWLEGRPIAELDAGWEVLLTAQNEVVARPFQD
ncbi:hypothetical protein [Microbacterium sp. NPDC058345]|uniref:hypothetical protein n=1 Tax=Microbacterium sp. NPDC058345 TaxID=3346455 RepID=UPI00366659CA